MSATNVAFSSHGTVCRGTLECPGDGDARRWPLVILAHGLAAEQDFGLAPFVERFHAAPRQHIEDLHAAIDFARARPEVDAARIALWGTSFGGAHVLEVAFLRDHVPPGAREG